MKNQKEKIRLLLQQPRWKVALFMLLLNMLLLWQAAIDWYFYVNFNFLFARRAFFKRTRQRAHWVGSHVAKPHRLAALSLAGTILYGLIKAPHIHAALFWATGWGLVFSLFVIYQSVTRMLHSQNKAYQRHHR